MSAVVESAQCFPKALTIGTFTFPAPEACHERCPGGHTIPGVMGGWVCPCECHRGTPVVPELIDGGDA